MIGCGIASIDGVGVLDTRPMYDILEGKEPNPTKPAHEAILERARAITELEMRTAHHAPEMLNDLVFQAVVRFDDTVPTEFIPEMAKLVMQAGMKTKNILDQMLLAYVVRLLGIEATNALAEELGFKLAWAGVGVVEESERLYLMTPETYAHALEDQETPCVIRGALDPKPDTTDDTPTG